MAAAQKAAVFFCPSFGYALALLRSGPEAAMNDPWNSDLAQPMDTLSVTLSAIGAAVRESNFDRANALAVEALAQGKIHPALYNAQAMWHERQGRDQEAAALFRRALRAAPADATTLGALGLCLSRLKRFDEAIAALSAAAERRPESALAHYRLGHTLWQAGRLPEAEGAVKRALALDAQMPAALSCMAAIVAAQGDMTVAGSFARRALQLAPGDPLALTVAAASYLAAGQPAEAASAIRPLIEGHDLPPDARAKALDIFARAQFLQGHAAESFESFRARNALLQHGRPRETADPLRPVHDFLATAPRSFWRAGRPSASVPAQRPDRHVFLSAFPRSGVELLAQILKRHPGIALLQDSDPLARAATRHLSTSEGLSELAALSDEALINEREQYWASVHANALGVAGKVLIDSTPANAFRLPLIAKLFPEARVIYMLRDPRDVVASCFTEFPRITGTILGAPDLEGIARLFDTASNIIRISRDRMPSPLAAIRYESLVSDAADSLSGISQFIDLSWEKDLFELDKSLGEDFGYFSERPGGWRQWTEQFNRVLPLLMPWVVQGGYE